VRSLVSMRAEAAQKLGLTTACARSRHRNSEIEWAFHAQLLPKGQRGTATQRVAPTISNDDDKGLKVYYLGLRNRKERKQGDDDELAQKTTTWVDRSQPISARCAETMSCMAGGAHMRTRASWAAGGR